MNSNSNSIFQHILNSDEEILWLEKPPRKPFLLVTLPAMFALIFGGLISFTFIYAFAGQWFSFGNENGDTSIPLYGYIPIVLISFPLWLGLLYPFYMIMTYKNIFYCYTNRRIVIRSGAWGVDYKTIEYDQITDLEVKVGPVGEKYATGNIIIFTGSDSEGKKISKTMYAITKPYEVFKNLKKVMLDIKTDFYYPNELRPEINKGYKTEYRP